MPTTASGARHTPIPTPATTPGPGGAAGDARRGVKREREESVSGNGTNGTQGGVTVVTNGWSKSSAPMNAKAGSGGVRPRPVKKPRLVGLLSYRRVAWGDLIWPSADRICPAERCLCNSPPRTRNLRAGRAQKACRRRCSSAQSIHHRSTAQPSRQVVFTATTNRHDSEPYYQSSTPGIITYRIGDTT